MYVMIKGNIGQFCGLVEIIVGDFLRAPRPVGRAEGHLSSKLWGIKARFKIEITQPI